LRSRIPKRSTERGQYKEAFDGTRAYEVGRARIDLKGKVLAIATRVDINRVDADRKAKGVSTMEEKGRRRESHAAGRSHAASSEDRS